ncbi:MAG: O-antigen ligase family protein [Actinomycetota bacterium]|nr:O-antigen ligase family protein [Actinomycetota bacterium]
MGRRAQAGTGAAAAGFAAVAIAGNPAAAGLGLLALTALVIAYQRPYLLGPFVLLLLPAGERIHILGAQVAPLEAVVGGGAIGYLARLAMRRERLRIRWADWAFAALVACMALSVFGPVDNSDRVRDLLFWGALGIVSHACSAHLDTRRDLKLILVALSVSTLVEASWALFEYLDGWSERFSLLGGAIVYPLPNGTLGHPNALAQFLVLAVLAVLALALGEAGAPRRLGFLAAGAGSLALVVTFSRGAWIALAVGASVYLVERRTRVPVLFAGALVVVGAAALALLEAGAIGARISSLFRGETGELYEFRFELVGRAARIVASHPLTGSGHFEEVGVYAGRPDLATHPHNLFLGLAVFFGIPAAVAFGALVVLALRAAWKGFRIRTGAQRLTAVGFLALLSAFLVNGLLEYPFWNTSLTVLVVLVLAVAVTLDRQAPPGPSLRQTSFEKESKRGKEKGVESGPRRAGIHRTDL